MRFPLPRTAKDLNTPAIYQIEVRMNEQLGRWAFIIGLVISIIAGFVNVGNVGLAVLVILGIIVGFLNVTGKEVETFLLGTVALMLVGTVGQTFGSVISSVITAFTSFVAGAALIVALKAVYSTTKEK
jgi:hypothetical protein